jgi:hypothetical protein
MMTNHSFLMRFSTLRQKKQSPSGSVGCRNSLQCLPPERNPLINHHDFTQCNENTKNYCHVTRVYVFAPGLMSREKEKKAGRECLEWGGVGVLLRVILLPHISGSYSCRHNSFRQITFCSRSFSPWRAGRCFRLMCNP